jgi:hypothetical protein
VAGTIPATGLKFNDEKSLMAGSGEAFGLSPHSS